jgi:hypothetical protein
MLRALTLIYSLAKFSNSSLFYTKVWNVSCTHTDGPFVDIIGCKNIKYNILKTLVTQYTTECELFTLMIVWWPCSYGLLPLPGIMKEYLSAFRQADNRWKCKAWCTVSTECISLLGHSKVNTMCILFCKFNLDIHLGSLGKSIIFWRTWWWCLKMIKLCEGSTLAPSLTVYIFLLPFLGP